MVFQMKNVLKFLSFSILLAFSSCSNKQAETRSSYLGSQQMKTKENEFVVDFKGGGLTSLQKADEYALVKASEVCLANGFEYFKVLKKEVSDQSRQLESSSDASKEEYILFSFNKRERVLEEKFYSIRLSIRCYKDNPRIFNIINANEYLKYNKKY